MPVTTLDPKTALVLIDLQKGIVGLPPAHVIDAMADLNPEAHANSIERIFPRLGETATTGAIIDLLTKTHA